MICKICLSESGVFQKAVILNKHDIAYYKCSRCGFVHTEDPFWLDEAYKDPIHISDTGILTRNLYLSKIAATIIYFLFDKSADFLDYAGGYGILTRLMRDNGFNFYWSDAYAKNLFAKGFEYPADSGNIGLITSFESFEHFADPLKEIQKMLVISKNILFSTEILPEPAPALNEWWYYVLEGGQHIAFYSMDTLNFIADKFKLNLYTDGTSLHLLTEKKMNPVFFRLLIKLSRFGLFHYVKKTMKSRTFDDHKILQRE